MVARGTGEDPTRMGRAEPTGTHAAEVLRGERVRPARGRAGVHTPLRSGVLLIQLHVPLTLLQERPRRRASLASRTLNRADSSPRLEMPSTFAVVHRTVDHGG